MALSQIAAASSAQTKTGRSGELRRGWRVLAACCVGLGLGLSGISFFTFGVFVVPLVKAFGWTRGQTASGASILVLGTAITAPIIGAIIDRFGARRVGIISMIGVALAYAALTQIRGNISAFYGVWMVLALAGGGTTPVLWTRTINLWFDKARGFALGLTLAGAGLSGIFGPPFCAALIRDYGWKAGYLGIGALILLVALPVVIFLFNEHPGRKSEADPNAAEHQGRSLGEAVRTLTFWKIAIGFFLVAGPLAAFVVNLVPLLIDRGMASVEGAQIAGFLGIAVIIGRIGVGWLVDRFSPLSVICALLCAAAISCLSLTVEGQPVWVTVISVIVIGFAVGAEVDMVAFFSSRYFGMKAYGKIYGWQTTSFFSSAALGQFVVGMTYDRFHSYFQVLCGTAGAIALGAVILGSLPRPPKAAET